MKSLLLPLFIIAILSCSQKPATDNIDAAPTVSVGTPAVSPTAVSNNNQKELFTITDAEAILGEPVHVTDSTTGNQQGISAYRSSYTATAGSATRPVINFLVEEYRLPGDAQNKFSFIKASHESSGGFKTLSGLGEEAYFNSDNNKFYFTMIRKGTRVASLRVNNITNKTSLDEFNRVAKELAGKL